MHPSVQRGLINEGKIRAVFIIIFITSSNSCYLHKLGNNMTILIIECTNVAGISAHKNGQSEPITRVALEDVEYSDLIIALMEHKEVGVREILDHILVEDIEAFLRGDLHE